MSKNFDSIDFNKPKQIKLTSQYSKEIKMLIAGTGDMTVDWGDGTCERFTLLAEIVKEEDNDYYDNWYNDYYSDWRDNKIETLKYGYRHIYSNKSIHTITLIGENITHLCCDGNQLTNLDVSNNTSLAFLSCDGNELTTLDVGKNIKLEYLQCDENQLTSLDVSKNIALRELRCSYNKIMNLDITNNTKLKILGCHDNQLTSLDVCNNTMLYFLNCEDNHLTSLIGIRKTKIMWGKNLYCRNNQFSAETLNNLFDRLPYDREKSSLMYIGGNPGTDNCNRNIAGKRGWTVEVEPLKSDKLLKVSKELTTRLNQMTLILQPKRREVSIQIIGTGTVTIDWGDKVCETYILTEAADNDEYFWGEEEEYNSHSYSHEYGYSYKLYTITIVGENITGLYCERKKIKELDVSKNKKLKELHCSENCLTRLNVNGAVSLQELDCSNNRMTHLDVSRNTALESLNCKSNQLVNLDVSKNVALKELHCSDNCLTKLNVNGAVSLHILDCSKNHLAHLDMSRTISLEKLYCCNNQLTYLDIRNNTRMYSLWCSNNQLTYLDVSNNSYLRILMCSNNQLSMDALNDLFGMLPFEWRYFKGRKYWHIENSCVIILGNPGAGSCDRIIAQSKGWLINTTKK